MASLLLGGVVKFIDAYWLIIRPKIKLLNLKEGHQTWLDLIETSHP